MEHEQAHANLQRVLDWADVRRRDLDAIAERFHPDVASEDVSGAVPAAGAARYSAGCPQRPPNRPTKVEARDWRRASHLRSRRWRSPSGLTTAAPDATS
jgi:hypothetical protein